MTPQQLAAATGTNVANATAWLPSIEAACARHGITAVKHQAWFLAQIGEESGGLTVVKENLFYSTPERLCQVWPSRFPTVAAATLFTKNPVALAEKVYGGRAELGNTSPGDGGKFLGRGLIQLTGKDWYAKYQAATGNQVLTSPELLESKALAADSAAWYWTADGCGAFVDRSDLTGLTKRINGGRRSCSRPRGHEQPNCTQGRGPLSCDACMPPGTPGYRPSVWAHATPLNTQIQRPMG